MKTVIINYQKKNYFIKLQLSQKINFVDEGTIADYQRKQSDFISLYSFDKFYDFNEKRYIPGVDEYLLVKICDEEPACVNFGLFYLFSLLTLGEFYKIYFNYFCLKQDYTIKKIISTRYNLNLEEFNLRYKNVNPVFNFIKIQYTFEPSDYNYLNKDYSLPSQEEVENANNNSNKNKNKN